MDYSDSLSKPEVFAHSIDRTLWYFTPVLTANRFRGDDDGKVAPVWVVVNMREAADLAVMHALALDVVKRTSEAAANLRSPSMARAIAGRTAYCYPQLPKLLRVMIVEPP
jgi:hypothetical protein